MKIVQKFLIGLGISFFIAGCSDGTFTGTATVNFKNVSESETVCAVWNGVSYELDPGETDSTTANEGVHTFKWTDCYGTDLSSLAWPDVVAGHVYTYTYPI